ncbi:serine/threonine-protein kinase [Pseudonocardia acaciae]|uniref:serine/threonine-protein kinase n=1 Tax=Pseudonocardia acaciae TaxID=551276 RepID=UPI000687163B|nr:serine/threonine-protein kinase [Pseudonocardia acaciae]
MEGHERLFGRYRLVRSIARGGTGTVWEAEDLLLAQRVALKHVSFANLPAEQAELARARILREARMAAQLRGHRHVVTIYDVIESDGDVWLVLEYVPAASLTEALTDGRPMSLIEIARIGAAVADALAAAHDRGVIHRDIRPGTILIGVDQRTVKLTDFGLSHAAADDQLLTGDNAVSGTPAYMAREVARGEPPTPASDIFSLGATLYRAIEGAPPYGEDPNPRRMLLRVATYPINPPATRTPLTSLIMRLLELDPNTRPDAATVSDQLHALARRVSEGTLRTRYPVPAPSPPTLGGGRPTALAGPGAPTLGGQPPGPPEPRPARRPRRPMAVAAIAAFALAAGLAVALPRLLDNTAPTGAPPLPAAIRPITLSGDPRAADPCALIDPTWLRQFGEPVTVRVRKGALQSCEAGIGVGRQDSRLLVSYREPVSSVSDRDGEKQRVGDITVVHRRTPESGFYAVHCSGYIILSDRSEIVVQAVGAGFPDLCAAAWVGISAAVNVLDRDGVVYRPGRTAQWRIADNDACALLDPSTLATVPDLEPYNRVPGFANWSCTWDSTKKGGPSVYTLFNLFEADQTDVGAPTTIAGRRAWTKLVPGTRAAQRCMAMVATRPTPTAQGDVEVLELSLEGPQPGPELCARATELAVAALGKLR